MKEHENARPHVFALHPGVDTRIEWALGPGAPYVFEPTGGRDESRPLTILVETIGVTPRQFAFGTGLIDEEYERLWPTVVEVPPLYLGAEPPHVGRRPTHFVAHVSEAFFALLGNELNAGLRQGVQRVTMGIALPRGAYTTFGHGPNPPGLAVPGGGGKRSKKRKKPPPVVIGIIDDNLAFLHERFRTRNDRTRVEYVWLQGLTFQGHDYHHPPLLGSEGVELHKADGQNGVDGLDCLLRRARRGGQVDEDLAYRLAGLVDFAGAQRNGLALRAAHGTHVMDLAAGYDPRTRKHEPRNPRPKHRDDRPIVCVQLPDAIAADTSGLGLEPYLDKAIAYILARADDIATQRGTGPLPVVINFSYGTFGGPHDGTSQLEADLDQRIADRDALLSDRLAVVLPAGNSHLSQSHAEVTFDADHPTRTLRWRLSPDDRTPSSLEIWMPPRGDDCGDGTRMEVVVRAPSGEELEPIGEEAGFSLPYEPNGVELARIDYMLVPAPTDRGRFLVTIAPTADPLTGVPHAPSGTWEVELRNVSLGADEAVHAWVQRDDSRPGYGRLGRQSRLDDDGYVLFDVAGRAEMEDHPDCLVQRAGSINGIGTGDRTVVVGGHLGHGRVGERERPMARYSAGGALPLGHRLVGPDASAVAEDSFAHPGLLAAGTRSGATTAMGGTSVAAPQVARMIADAFAAGHDGGRAEVVAWAESADPDQFGKPADERAGGGRLPPMRAVALARYEP